MNSHQEETYSAYGCHQVKPLDAFSDAQLAGRGKCLACSNPRLLARRLEESLAGSPLPASASPRAAEALRINCTTAEASRINCAEAEASQISPFAAEGSQINRTAAEASRINRTAAEASWIKCTACREAKPPSAFSRRQLSGKGRCARCAADSTAANLREQAEARLKRGREDSAAGSYGSERSRADEEYEHALLQSVEEAQAAHEKSKRRAQPPLDESNPGHQMLQRLGWEVGTGLGARSDGEVVPLAVSHCPQRNRLGLGQL
ncbi:hypothetical protein AB1Y20_006036 [Prymnesium parvum]|uniref:G-patch domain-containing protein n=1 Tax=Prymnesium parvum TaxID=97485 RepID=A0AB34J1H4_PRYPA